MRSTKGEVQKKAQYRQVNSINQFTKFFEEVTEPMIMNIRFVQITSERQQEFLTHYAQGLARATKKKMYDQQGSALFKKTLHESLIKVNLNYNFHIDGKKPEKWVEDKFLEEVKYNHLLKSQKDSEEEKTVEILEHK